MDKSLVCPFTLLVSGCSGSLLVFSYDLLELIFSLKLPDLSRWSSLSVLGWMTPLVLVVLTGGLPVAGSFGSCVDLLSHDSHDFS